MLRIIFILISLLVQKELHSQISFTKDNGTYKNLNSWSGIAGGFVDVNGDLTDDIILLNKGRLLQIGFNTGRNNPLKWSNEKIVFQIPEYAVVVGDLDNNYQQEIISNGSYSGTKIYKHDSQGNLYFDKSIPTSVYSQATNLVDINNDNFLDLFICHDEGTNLTLINDGFGNLVPQNIIDFSTIPASDNSGSYGSEWADIDNDGDQDLYIAKCRFGVTDPEDPRRHNMLFINNNGSFTNEAEQRGLKIKSQSWTGGFADFDNDGDYDCFTSNHDNNHDLMKNDSSGYFVPYESNITFKKSFAYQVLLADFDNNGYVDIFITGPDNTSLYQNIDGFNFERANLFNETPISSCVFGDINDDGFLDLFAFYSVNINLPGSKKDDLFINNGNQNSFAKFTLKGNASNANGVGARINSFSQSGIKTRQVQSGVSYGITNTLTQHIGFGSDTLIDSLIIYWPSGIIDKYYNLELNQHYFVQEGICISKKIDLIRNKEVLCKNDSITLTSGISSLNNFKWSNGDTISFTHVFSNSSIFLFAKDSVFCEYISNIAIIKLQDLQNESLISNEADTIYICKNEGEVLFKNKNVAQITWPDGSTGNSYFTDEEGRPIISAKDACDEIYFDTLNIQLVSDIVSTEIKLKVGVDTTLFFNADKVEWYSDAAKTNLLSNENHYSLKGIADTITLYVNVFNKKGAEKYYLGITNLPSSNQFSSDQVDGGLYLNVFDSLTLKSFIAKTDKAGMRRILIIKYEGDTIFSKDVMIEKDTLQKIELNALIPPGTFYQLKTDQTINNNNFGYDGPRLYRTNSNVTYPYATSSILEIPSSTKGPAAYYYFYNLEFEKGGVSCFDTASVTIIPDTIVGNRDIFASERLIYPNPSSEVLYLKGNNIQKIRIIDMYGRVVIVDSYRPTKVSVQNLQSGIYTIEIIEETKEVWRRKVMIARK